MRKAYFLSACVCFVLLSPVFAAWASLTLDLSGHGKLGNAYDVQVVVSEIMQG